MEKQNAANVIPRSAVLILVNTKTNDRMQTANVINKATNSNNLFAGQISEERTRMPQIDNAIVHFTKLDFRCISIAG